MAAISWFNIMFLLSAGYIISDGARILGIYNHPGLSHTFLGKVLLKNLAKRGHEITMISSFPLQEPIPNYRDINLVENLEDLKRREMMYFKREIQNEANNLNEMSMLHTENMFKHPEVNQLINSNEKFDVIIIDDFFNQGTYIFGHIFKAPIILMSSFGNNVFLKTVTGNSLPISYVPGGGFLMSDDISLKHKLLMFAAPLLIDWYRSLRLRNYDEMLKKYFYNPPKLHEMIDNIALVLSNSHFSVETPRPYTPNIIPIAGFHVEEPKDNLPKEIQHFLDSSPEGVIYFSLGSQIKVSNLDKRIMKSIVDTLAQLPVKVLWKVENDDIALPENVLAAKWIPQLNVLAHPNVKLFITHGGVLSFIESVHYGIPMMVVPVNGDQNTNAAFVESRGLGLYITMNELTEESFTSMINELISNPEYGQRAKYYSSLMRDQPISPMDNAIYWVEHVIKYKGAPHLKPFSLKLPWYKFYCIDVIGVIGLVLSIIVAILLVFIKLLCCSCKKITRKIKKE